MDHKPLLGLLKSRNLEDIENPRLLHLAERLTKWTFDIKHIAGAQNHAPDALSRYPQRHTPQEGSIFQVSGEFSPELRQGLSDQVSNLHASNQVAEEDQTEFDNLEAQVLSASATRRNLVVSLDDVKMAAISDVQYAALLHAVQHHDSPWPEELAEFKRFRQDLSSVEGIVLYKGRIVVPKILRAQTLSNLHSAHQGESGMILRTQHSVWWPGITSDVASTRARCTACNQNAPTQLPLPPVDPPSPQYPFQLIVSDYFYHKGHTYLLVVDRYSNWPVIRKCRSDTAEELVTALREYFVTYGVPDQLASDGGPPYVAEVTKNFLKTWGVTQRVSTSYNPHANLRAESGVKSIKRLIEDNTGPGGSINNDSLARALLVYRNTPDRDTKRSPAMILYARQLKDSVPCHPDKLRLRPEWLFTADLRDRALAKRHLSIKTELTAKSRPLPPLELNDVVQVQNQRGPHANKWELLGKIVEVQDFDAYLIKMDGSGRVTRRNRRFLRKIVPFHQENELVRNTAPPNAAITTQPEPTRDDAFDKEVQMSDKDFDSGLMAAAKRVHQESNTQPLAAAKSVTNPTSNFEN